MGCHHELDWEKKKNCQKILLFWFPLSLLYYLPVLNSVSQRAWL